MHGDSSIALEHCLYHSRLRCIFAIVPKAATTTIKHWFAATDAGGKPMAAGANVHDFLRETCAMNLLSAEQAADLFGDPSVFKFSFVRNPWTRLVSGYLDKVVGVEPPAEALIRNRLKRSWRGKLTLLRHRLTSGLKPVYQRGMSFREFVHSLENENLETVNRHFRPQSRILAHIPLDFMGRMEQFAADFSYVRERLGDPTPGQTEHKQSYQAAAGGDCVADWPAPRLRAMEAFPHWRRFYSPDLAERVVQLFAEDFAAFGYSPQLSAQALSSARETLPAIRPQSSRTQLAHG